MDKTLLIEIFRNQLMRTQGHNTETYYAIARPSGKPRPWDTELYGQFSTIEHANEVQKIIGGRVVMVTQTTQWNLDCAERSRRNS
jgi:hypothetical protein